MHKVIAAVCAALTLAGSLSATSIKAQLGTTLNTDDAYWLFTFDEDDNDFDLAFNADFGMTFNDTMGFNIMYAYSNEPDENTFRPAFTLSHKLGTKGWGIMLLTGPTFIIHSDDTDYGADVMGYITYDITRHCFVRAGTGLKFVWSKDSDDDWQWQGSVMMPEVGFGFTF